MSMYPTSLTKVQKLVNSRYNFSAPTIPAVGKADDREIVAFDSTSSNFRSDMGAQGRINIEDASRYLDLDSGLLAFQVYPRQSNGSPITGGTAPVFSNAGMGSLISRVTLSLNGVVIADVDGYNILHTLENHTEPRGRKACLQKTEYYYRPTIFADTSAQSGGIAVFLPLKLGMFMIDKSFPLGIVAGKGLTLDVYFGNKGDIFNSLGASTGAVGYLEITNLQFRCDLVKPSPEFQNSMLHWVEQGNALSLPYSRTFHDVHMPPAGSTTTISINTNFCQSLRHIVIVGRTAAVMASTDKLSGFSSLNVTSYQMKIGGVIIPRQSPFKYGNLSQEGLARMLASGKNIDTVVDTVTGEAPKNVDLWNGVNGHYISILLGTQEFSSGYDCRNVSDIKITLTCEGTPFTQGDRFDIFYTTDELLTISKGTVQCENQWLEV